MKKNIFAFVGSRSAKKNTYKFVEDIILEISKLRDIDYKILTLNDMNIKPCIGCEECFDKGACIQHDDLKVLEDNILKADLFILAAPVYMHGMPGEMKNIIDRLATWTHTMRLAGKKILLVSTCSSNGHTTVVDDMHLIILHMGGQVIGKYVGTNYIPDNMQESDSEIMLLKDAKEQLKKTIPNVVENWERRIISNPYNENMFQYMRADQQNIINCNEQYGETEYWIKSGMIKCSTFQEYLDLIAKDTIKV